MDTDYQNCVDVDEVGFQSIDQGSTEIIIFFSFVVL